MATEIIVTLITGAATLIGTIISIIVVNSKNLYRMQIIENNIQTLINKYDNVLERVYLLEKKTDIQEEQIRVANHRIEDLEDIDKEHKNNVRR